jgi:hypothetical protein
MHIWWSFTLQYFRVAMQPQQFVLLTGLVLD